MGGKRYDEEPKLNMKKVFSVFLGIVVVIMFCLTLSKLLQDGTEISNKKNEEPDKYFAVYTDNKWGVINQKGNYIITPKYAEMIIVPDENTALFACVDEVDYASETYKTSIINQNGEKQFTEYEDAELIVNYDNAQVLWYENNVIRVKNAGKYGLINFKGRELLKCEYDNIEALQGVKNTFIIIKDGKQGLSDSFGNIIVEPKYKQILPLEEDNKKEFIIINDANKKGIALSDGTVELECKYEDIKQITANNVYAVKIEGKWQVTNSDESIKLTEGFDDVIQMTGENFIVKKGNNYGVINLKGEEKIPAQYANITYAYGETFIVKQDNKYGVINAEQGETKLEIKYDELIYRTDSDLFVATIGEGEPQILNKEFEPKLTGIIAKVDSERGYIKIRTNGEYKYYNFKFDTIFLSQKDGKYGYINKQGEVVVDYIYNDATEQNEYGYASVNKDGKWGSLDKDGNEVVAPTYALENNTVIDFIGKWHIAEDLNANYYTDMN